jgi:hypothetical protein
LACRDGWPQDIKRMSRHPPTHVLAPGDPPIAPPPQGAAAGAQGRTLASRMLALGVHDVMGPSASRAQRRLRTCEGVGRDRGDRVTHAVSVFDRLGTHCNTPRELLRATFVLSERPLRERQVRVCSATKSVPRTLTPTQSAPRAPTPCTPRARCASAQRPLRQLPCVRTVLKHRVHRMHMCALSALSSATHAPVRSQRSL